MDTEMSVEQKEKEYGELVQNILANTYTINDQIAIIKHALVKGTDTDEFKAFVEAGEKAKTSAKTFIISIHAPAWGATAHKSTLISPSS